MFRFTALFLSVIFQLVSAFSAFSMPEGSSREEVLLPVVMYHSVLQSVRSEYVVTKKQLDEDLAYMKRLGYDFVSAGEVIDFCNGNGDLPKKPLLLTFDDGNYNNLCYGLPILQKHGAVAVVSVIASAAEFYSSAPDRSVPAYSTLTFSEINELKASGVIEIGNHTYDLHGHSPQGIARKAGESDEAYRKRLYNDLSHAQTLFKDNCGITLRVFAYPFGKQTDFAEKLLLEFGFEMLLSCKQAVNVLSFGDKRALASINRFNRNGNLSTEAALAFLR